LQYQVSGCEHRIDSCGMTAARTGHLTGGPSGQT
jgi:hypothetical protein